MFNIRFTENILVIGGSTEMLHPTFISLDKDGGTKIETCSNRIGFVEREYPVGQFLEDGFVICVGSFAWSFKVLDDCIVVKRFETQTLKMMKEMITQSSEQFHQAKRRFTNLNVL